MNAGMSVGGFRPAVIGDALYFPCRSQKTLEAQDQSRDILTELENLEFQSL